MKKLQDTLQVFNEKGDSFWVENGKSWYQYINSDSIYRQHDVNYYGKSFEHKRCPFCDRITSIAALHWFNHLTKCAPEEYSLSDISELRFRKIEDLRGSRIGRKNN